nr:hypothetical protein [Miltoncostaea oceani]
MPSTNASRVIVVKRIGLPAAAAMIRTASRNVSASGPVSSYSRPAWPSPVNAATATSATSSTSTNGSGTASTGSASSPASSGACRCPSEKFCMNQAQRSTVHAAPDARSASSARAAPSSPRPDSSTRRRTPVSRAMSARAATASAAPGTARSGA